MNHLLLTLLLLSSTRSIFSEYLLPVNRCLGNCSICEYNSLEQCSYDSCEQHFYGKNCLVQPSLNEPIYLLHSSESKWKNQTTMECRYDTKGGKQQVFPIFGIYEVIDSNEVQIQVKPFYKIMILSFNLIRTSWTPYSDLLKITLKSKNDKLKEYIIDYERRQEIDPLANLIRCKNIPMLPQKFSVQFPLIHKNITLLSIFFEGYIFSGAQWGIANAKLMFGCGDFALYNQKNETCDKCQKGFYALKENSQFIGCQLCKIYCIECNENGCLSCISQKVLQNGQCKNNQKIETRMVNISKHNIHCGSKIMLNTEIKEKIHLQNNHNESRLIFYIYGAPEQWEQQSFVQLLVNGQVVDKFIPDFGQAKKQCKNFGEGYYSLYKVITQRFLHEDQNMEVQIRTGSEKKIGIEYLIVEYEINEAEEIQQFVEENKNETVNQTNISQQFFITQQRKGQFQLNIQYPYVIVKILYPFLSNYTITVYLKNRQFFSNTIFQTSNYTIIKVKLKSSLINQELDFHLINIFDQNRRKKIGKLNIVRFDAYSNRQVKDYENIRQMLEVIVYISIVFLIILTLLGKSIIIQEFIILLQTIFVHFFIYTPYLPTPLKISLLGLNRIINLNYFLPQNQKIIESWLLGNVIQNSPLKFIQFKIDINFTRAIYPIVLLNLIYFVYFLVVHFFSKKLREGLTMDGEEDYGWKENIKIFIIALGERIMNFWYPIFQYSFIVVVWSAFVQFHNVDYPENSNRNSGANLVFCILSLLVMVLVPFLVVKYIRSKYYRLEYIQYFYWFEDVFYLKLPYQSLPSSHHRHFIIVKNAKYLFSLLAFAFLGDHPFICLILLFVFHSLIIFYIQFSKVQISIGYKIFTFIQLVLLILFQLCFAIIHSTSTYLPTQIYKGLGYVAIGLMMGLIVNGMGRIGYLAIKYVKQGEKKEKINEFKGEIGTERVV